MAVTGFSPSHILVQICGPPSKHVTKIVELQHSQIQLKKAPTLVVRSSFKNKVFENQSEGIVCYRNDDGEIICEGYDEGPRFQQHFPNTEANHLRDPEIINLLQQRLLQIVNGCELNSAAIPVQEDFNGFNKFC